VNEQVRPGQIDYPEVQRQLAIERIELRGGAADEAPAAYKRLNTVLGYHSDTIRVLRSLTPIGVAMAGPDIYDPWKD
jgi:tRNA-splicing ligase RtcB